MPNVLITGASRGIGLESAKVFLDKGYTVYSFSRSAPPDERIIHFECDLADEQSIIAAVGRLRGVCDSLDLLINNGGYGISGALEGTTLESARRLFDVNFFGTFLCIKYLLPLLRVPERATIINISSLASIFPLPYQSFYSATKSAINALTLALINELRGGTVRVCALMPGDVKTSFTAARVKNAATDPLYARSESRAVGKMEKDERAGMQPEKIARFLYKLSKKRAPKPLYTLGFGYRLLALCTKILPCALVNYIEGKIYQ